MPPRESYHQKRVAGERRGAANKETDAKREMPPKKEPRDLPLRKSYRLKRAADKIELPLRKNSQKTKRPAIERESCH